MNAVNIPVEKAREELTALLKDAAKGQHHYILTDKKGPIGTLMSASEYDKLMRQTEFVRKREQYLRMLIEEGISTDELRTLLEKMDEIDKAFKSGNKEALMREADEYAERKIKEWCTKQGIKYNPTDEESAQEFINAAIRKVRAEGKQ